jgi:hypothetical protein
MLFTLAMTWNSCIENRSKTFALILPAWVVCLRYFTHKGTIHQIYFLIFVDLNWSITLWSTLAGLFLIRLSGMISIDTLAWWSCRFESTCYSLSESIWLGFIRQYFLSIYLFILSFVIFGKYNLMYSSFLLGWFKSVNKW